MPELAYVNGTWSTIEAACVSIDDRGFQFGDGVYEVIRSYDGRLWALDRHLRRLEHSMRAIALTGAPTAEVKPRIIELFERGQMREGVVYLQVTRGVAPRRHAYNAGGQPTVVMTVRAQHAVDIQLYASGVPAITVPEIRWSRRDIKSTNLLGNILAKQRAVESGAYEAIFVEADGRVTEGSSTNVFIVRKGCLLTREKGPHILAGITRDLIVETALEQGISVEERPFTVEEMRAADELFLTGTGTEVLGVVTLDQQRIQMGRVGDLTRALLDAFHERVRQARDD
jgi:D-alanine transaminase